MKGGPRGSRPGSVRNTRIFLYKNVLSGLNAWKEIEIATSKTTTMFLNFGPLRSYKHSSCERKNVKTLD